MENRAPAMMRETVQIDDQLGRERGGRGVLVCECSSPQIRYILIVFFALSMLEMFDFCFDMIGRCLLLKSM